MFDQLAETRPLRSGRFPTATACQAAGMSHTTSRGIGYRGRVLEPLDSACDQLDLIDGRPEVHSQSPLCR